MWILPQRRHPIFWAVSLVLLLEAASVFVGDEEGSSSGGAPPPCSSLTVTGPLTSTGSSPGDGGSSHPVSADLLVGRSGGSRQSDDVAIDDAVDRLVNVIEASVHDGKPEVASQGGASLQLPQGATYDGGVFDSRLLASSTGGGGNVVHDGALEGGLGGGLLAGRGAGLGGIGGGDLPLGVLGVDGGAAEQELASMRPTGAGDSLYALPPGGFNPALGQGIETPKHAAAAVQSQASPRAGAPAVLATQVLTAYSNHVTNVDAPACLCKAQWSYPKYNSCNTTQKGCPPKACDHANTAWCLVSNKGCKTEESGQGWSFCGEPPSGMPSKDPSAGKPMFTLRQAPDALIPRDLAGRPVSETSPAPAPAPSSKLAVQGESAPTEAQAPGPPPAPEPASAASQAAAQVVPAPAAAPQAAAEVVPALAAPVPQPQQGNAALEPCLCAERWRDTSCSDVAQEGCPATPCGGKSQPWCLVVNPKCATAEPAGWSYCDPPTRPQEPQHATSMTHLSSHKEAKRPRRAPLHQRSGSHSRRAVDEETLAEAAEPTAE